MEESRDTQLPEETQESYVPRPTWQVWGARIGLVLFLLLVIYQLIHIATGGQI